MSIPANVNKLLLIKSVHQRPALWDRTLNSYKNKSRRTAAWHAVCEILRKDYNKLNEHERENYYKLVIKMWTYTRDSWARNFNIRKNAKKAGLFVPSAYKYHKELLFLKKVKFGRYVEESEDTEDDEEEKEDEIIAESDSDSAAVCEKECYADSKEDIDLTAMNQDNTTNEKDDITEKRQDNNISEDMLNAKMQAYLNNRVKQISKPGDTNDDRHFAFFKSIHPTLTLLDDDQILEFQSGVINLLRNIKSGGRLNNVANNQPSSSSSIYTIVSQL